MQACAVEICSKEHQPVGMLVVGTVEGLGMILGPAIGGFLSQVPLLDALSLCFGNGCCGARHHCETLHVHEDEDAIIDGQTFKENANLKKLSETVAETNRMEFLLQPVHNHLNLFSVGHQPQNAWMEVLQYDGCWKCLALAGTGTLLSQLLAFRPVTVALGSIAVTRYAAILALPLLCVSPFLSQVNGPLMWILVIFTTVSKNSLSIILCPTGPFVILNDERIFCNMLGV
ncbi:hypothetical protein R1flu_009027 [Riccia fluitans]|uniref:Uncharacterized protein n=1 Tax=Riccia fluitans TaxID=41844 RepID=A0ABD1Z155_9MARC